MAYLCYSLTEAAQKLELSETVLIRLSQFLRVPATAYDTLGRSLTYKGDLLLTDADITFFQQVKERLLKGESLEDIKRRIVPEAIDVLPASGLIPALLPSGERAQPSARGEGQEAVQLQAAMAPKPLKEIKSAHTLQNVADKTFERYRAEHRTPPQQVFKHLVQETTPGRKDRLQSSGLSASTEAMIARLAGGSAEAIMPKSNQNLIKPPEMTTSGKPQAFSGQLQAGKLMRQAGSEQPWQPLIDAAIRQPRQLNIQLKTAAQLLKQKALRLQRAGL